MKPVKQRSLAKELRPALTIEPGFVQGPQMTLDHALDILAVAASPGVDYLLPRRVGREVTPALFAGQSLRLLHGVWWTEERRTPENQSRTKSEPKTLLQKPRSTNGSDDNPTTSDAIGPLL